MWKQSSVIIAFGNDASTIAHAVRQVHCHFLDLGPGLLRQLEQDFDNVLRLRAADHDDDCSFPAMASLVGHNGEKVVLERCLVDTHIFTEIERIQDPVLGVVPLVPHRKVTQVVLVRTFELVTVNVVCSPKGPRRRGRRIRFFFQELGELRRELRSFGHKCRIHIKDNVLPLRSQPPAAAYVQHKFLFTNRKVIQDRLFRKPFGRVVLRLFRPVVLLVKENRCRAGTSFFV